MLKKLFIATMIFSLIAVGSAFATCGGNDNPCKDPDTIDPAKDEVGIYQAIGNEDNTPMNGGKAVGAVSMSGNSTATGRDTIKTEKIGYEYVGGECNDGRCPRGYYEKINGNSWWIKEGHVKYFRNGHPTKNSDWKFLGSSKEAIYETSVIEGESTAYALTDMTMTSSVDINTNGKQLNAGPSYSFVKSSAELNITGDVWAKGTQGCPQTADISVEGSLGALAYGGSYSAGPNGSYASAKGLGQTTVSFNGYESDQSTKGPLFGLFPNKAGVDFDSTVNVDQSLTSLSYVSKDGTTAANFAHVGGGSAQLNLGRDGIFGFGRDNINLTGIQAEGSVAQNAMATNGTGSYAFGGSSAYFRGAEGTVNSTRSWSGPEQIANVGGMAVVGGYNNVTTSAGSVTVTSHQFGYATTGNTQIIESNEPR